MTEFNKDQYEIKLRNLYVKALTNRDKEEGGFWNNYNGEALGLLKAINLINKIDNGED